MEKVQNVALGTAIPRHESDIAGEWIKSVE